MLHTKEIEGKISVTKRATTTLGNRAAGQVMQKREASASASENERTYVREFFYIELNLAFLRDSRAARCTATWPPESAAVAE